MSFLVCWLACCWLLPSKVLVWFGFSSVFCTAAASASASCSSSGVSFGEVAASRKADEKRREEKRREEKKGTLFIPKRL
jgi:hypothetical protein